MWLVKISGVSKRQGCGGTSDIHVMRSISIRRERWITTLGVPVFRFFLCDADFFI